MAPGQPPEGESGTQGEAVGGCRGGGGAARAVLVMTKLPESLHHTGDPQNAGNQNPLRNSPSLYRNFFFARISK